MSPPVWVAWIEIRIPLPNMAILSGRHPYGWRGLKSNIRKALNETGASPPVWVAWIEIPQRLCRTLSRVVATRMGGVD